MTAQETIDRIHWFDRDGLPVASLYVAVAPDGSVHTRVNRLLDQIRPLAKDHNPWNKRRGCQPAAIWSASSRRPPRRGGSWG
jgi:hypothetical protein